MALNPNIPLSGAQVQSPNLLQMMQQAQQIRETNAARDERKRKGAYRKTLGELMQSGQGTAPMTVEQANKHLMGQYPMFAQAGLDQESLRKTREGKGRREAEEYNLKVIGPTVSEWNKLPLMEKQAMHQRNVQGLEARGVQLPDWFKSPEYTPEHQRYMDLMGQQYQATQKSKGMGQFSKNPIYYKDKQGNLQIGQLSEAGGMSPVDLPAGATPAAGTSRLDLGDRWGIQDNRTGEIISYEAKSLKPGDEPEIRRQQAKAAAEGKIEAGIESGTVIPKQEEILKAKKNLTSSLVRMQGLYEDLLASGGITDVEATGLSNLGAWAKSTGLGQGLQNMLGTKEQSIRNEIKAIRVALINAVRKASDMGAKGMDSEKELEFFLQTVTDEKKDFQSNMAAIAELDRALGLDIGMAITPELQAKIDAIHAEYDRRQGKFRKKPKTETRKPTSKKRRKATLEDF